MGNDGTRGRRHTASTIMPALLYTATVLLYVFRAHRVRSPSDYFSLGRWEWLIIAGALIWLAYELVILIGPAQFRDAQYYVLGALGVGCSCSLSSGRPNRRPCEEQRAHTAHRLGQLDYPGELHLVNILAIDQGTSSTKALVVAQDGEVLARASRPVHPRSVGADGVEQDPLELLDSVIAAGQQALHQAGAEVHALGLANQGETVLAFDPVSGEPHTPAIGWQDRRAVEVTARLADRRERLSEVCGLPLDPYFAAPKMTWVREHLTADGFLATTDAWLLHRLGVGYISDTATASRTMLLDLDRMQWSPENAAAFGLDPTALPRLVGCAEPVGETSAFGPPLPVTGLAVDQQAALFGQGCLRAGQGKCTYGTGAFLLATTGEVPRRSGAGLSASVAWTLSGSTTYCLDGQVYTVGAAIDWLRQLGLLTGADDLDRLGGSVPDSGGVVFFPAWRVSEPHTGAPMPKARAPA